MKPLILCLTVILLTNCSKDNQHNNISQYREQYTTYANELITNTDTELATVILNKLEQFKQTNLHLFKNK